MDINQWPYNPPDSLRELFAQGDKTWRETNYKTYMNQLECLPPIRMTGDAFMVGECYCASRQGNVYAAFIDIHGRYFCRLAPLSQYDPAAFVTEIRKQFNF